MQLFAQRRRRKPAVSLTPEQKAEAIRQVRAGRSRKEVAASLGLSIHTLHLWMSLLRRAKAGGPASTSRSIYKRLEALEAEVEDLKKRVAAKTNGGAP